MMRRAGAGRKGYSAPGAPRRRWLEIKAERCALSRGPSKMWLKSKNSVSEAVRREPEDEWHKPRSERDGRGDQQNPHPARRFGFAFRRRCFGSSGATIRSYSAADIG